MLGKNKTKQPVTCIVLRNPDSKPGAAGSIPASPTPSTPPRGPGTPSTEIFSFSGGSMTKMLDEWIWVGGRVAPGTTKVS